MKFATAIVAATVAAVASAQPAWNFPLRYDDVNSNGPFFLASLSYNYEVGTPNTKTFDAKSDFCIASCPQKEQRAYLASYPLKLNWYKTIRSTGRRRRRL
ncbi:hypothetical protein BGZ81_001887 [Podila clonocystis]|nr:hypothetical protein BGZ81_001887 [Podila clonocystis]